MSDDFPSCAHRLAGIQHRNGIALRLAAVIVSPNLDDSGLVVLHGYLGRMATSQRQVCILAENCRNIVIVASLIKLSFCAGPHGTHSSQTGQQAQQLQRTFQALSKR